MHNLTLADLRLVLDEMLERHLHHLRSTGVGRSYELRLQWYRQQLLRWLPPAGSARPLADRLALASSTHNALGAAIHHLLEAYLRVPGRGEDQRRSILRLRRAFMPRLAELRDSYATRAARALARRELLEAHMAELSAIPIHDGETLAHWVRAFIHQGCTLGELLACRADATASAVVAATDRADPSTLRGALIGLLGRLRAAIADELAGQPERLLRLDAELFTYVDQLAEMRMASHRVRVDMTAPTDGDGANDDGAASPAVA